MSVYIVEYQPIGCEQTGIYLVQEECYKTYDMAVASILGRPDKPVRFGLFHWKSPDGLYTVKKLTLKE